MSRAKRPIAVRVTVQDIADHAGVSIGAVSSVLTHRHLERRISPETVEKVRAVAAKLGYLPNISARRLRSGTCQRNHVVLAFVTSYEAPLSLATHLVLELRQAISGRGRGTEGMTFSVLMELFSAGRLSELPGLMTGDHFNAAIITNTTVEDDAFLAGAELPCPAVLVNRSIAGYSCVVEDPGTGAAAAAVLVRARRRRLAVLHGTPLTQTTRTRVDSFMGGAAKASGARAVHEIVADSLTEQGACEAVHRFLGRGEKVDGLYAVTDGLALGAYHAIKERGLRIPQDVAVVGVGDYDISPFFDPPLTVVGVPRSELGREASRLLLRQLESADRSPLKVEIPVRAELRASTGG